MDYKKVFWRFTGSPEWQLCSGNYKAPGFPTRKYPELTGMIQLPPIENFWYPCVQLILPNKAYGTAFLRYFIDPAGIPVVQAKIWATKGLGREVIWEMKSPFENDTCEVNKGGLELEVSLLAPLKPIQAPVDLETANF